MTDEAAKELTQDKVEDLLASLRSVGLYENRIVRHSAEEELPPGIFDTDVKPKTSKREVLIIDLFVGDLAFAERVQAPDQAEIDRQFSSLTRQFEQDEDEQIKAHIRRRLADGKDPFGDD